MLSQTRIASNPGALNDCSLLLFSQPGLHEQQNVYKPGSSDPRCDSVNSDAVLLYLHDVSNILSKDLHHTFPSLKHGHGLMVGIAGGVPGVDADIGLGDVVISQPQGCNGGVMQSLI